MMCAMGGEDGKGTNLTQTRRKWILQTASDISALAAVWYLAALLCLGGAYICAYIGFRFAMVLPCNRYFPQALCTCVHNTATTFSRTSSNTWYFLVLSFLTSLLTFSEGFVLEMWQ